MSRKASTAQKKKQRRRKPKGRGVGGVRVQPKGPKVCKPKTPDVVEPAQGVSAGDKSTANEPRVSLRFLTIQRAIYTLLEARKTVTFAAIGEEVGISRQNVWKFFQRHPDFLPYLDTQFNNEHQHMLGILARRMFMIAMQGSVAHADMFAKLSTGYYFRLKTPASAQDEDDVSPEDSRYVTHVNILVPHPQLPNGGRMPVFGPQPATGLPAGVDLKDIPTVAVR